MLIMSRFLNTKIEKKERKKKERKKERNDIITLNLGYIVGVHLTTINILLY